MVVVCVNRARACGVAGLGSGLNAGCDLDGGGAVAQDGGGACGGAAVCNGTAAQGSDVSVGDKVESGNTAKSTAQGSENSALEQKIRLMNQYCLLGLKELQRSQILPFKLEIIDCSSSEDLAVEQKYAGAGYARRRAMDFIASLCNERTQTDAERLQEDRFAASHLGEKAIIVSMDADTLYPSNYLEEINTAFALHPKAVGLTASYYHDISYSPSTADAVAALRYEIYMRSYLKSMAKYSLPYAFTAIGSAFAVKVSAYKKIGGMPLNKSGEDFYFLQKLFKMGSLIRCAKAIAYPSVRKSFRVGFGTGPAIATLSQNIALEQSEGLAKKGGETPSQGSTLKANQGSAALNQSSYPIFKETSYKELSYFFSMAESFYKDKNADLGLVGDFANLRFGSNWHEKLRRNSPNAKSFARAIATKFDGLRILQYLRFRQGQSEEGESSSVQTTKQTAAESLQTTFFKLQSLRNQLFKEEIELYHKNPIIEICK